jgi:hypothetical protein
MEDEKLEKLKGKVVDEQGIPHPFEISVKECAGMTDEELKQWLITKVFPTKGVS